MKRLAVIDLGSNTFRLALIEYEVGVRYRQLDELRALVQLSAGMTATGGIRSDNYALGLEVIEEFGSYCRAMRVDDVRATATSAVRGASNGKAFLRDAARLSGLEIDLLDGEDEARYGALAVANSFSQSDALVLDIGGGSAQLSLVNDGRFVRGVSWPIGAIRMTEEFISGDPPNSEGVIALRKYVAGQLREWPDPLPEGLPLIGMGGTVRNLAKIHQKRIGWPLDFLHGYSVTTNELAEIVEELAASNLGSREATPGLKRDRASIIVAGAVTVEEILRFTGAPALTVSGQGLREGLFYPFFLPHSADHLLADVRAFAIHNLVHRHQTSLEHPKHVKDIALSLFDGLSKLRGCDEPCRGLLAAAALVHDIGTSVNFHDHHKHNLFLMMRSALPGFSHREQAILGLVSRYHYKGTPAPQGYGRVLEEDDMRCVLELSAILRLADRLDRAHAQRVVDVRCRSMRGTLVIEAVPSPGADIGLEVREANLGRGLLEEAFGTAVEVVPGR